MADTLGPESLNQLFREARTFGAWLEKPVSDDTVHALYDLLKWGPTSVNGSPGRFLFLRTVEAKERLKPALSAGNVAKTMAAPVTVVVSYDLEFYEKLPVLAPHNPKLRDAVAADAAAAEVTAFRNGTLQGGYLILAARALGLDCGPMSGFDNAKVDAEFFAGTAWRSNFLCNLGYGDQSKLRPRGARLEFEEACRLL